MKCVREKIAATDMCVEMRRDEVHGMYESKIKRVSLTSFVC